MLLKVVAGFRGAAEARGQHIVAAQMRARADWEIIARCLWTLELKRMLLYEIFVMED